MVSLTLLCMPLHKRCILHVNSKKIQEKKASSSHEKFKYLMSRNWTPKRFYEVKMSNFSIFLVHVLLKQENHKCNSLEGISLDSLCCMLVLCHKQQKWGDGCYYSVNTAQWHLSAQAHKREYHVTKTYYTLFIHAIFNTARLFQAVVFLHVC